MLKDLGFIPSIDLNRCCRHPGCILTAGYYIGGGMYVCWMAAVANTALSLALAGQEMIALSPENRYA